MHHNVHDDNLDPFKRWPQRLYHRWWIKPMESWTLRHADRITAVSHYTGREIERTFRIADTHVIHNGIDLDIFRPPLERKRSPSFRLLYVGSWSARKGTDLLAPIMRCLGDDFELEYTWASHRPTPRDLPANCRSIGKPDLAGLVTAYQRCDALLFPSRLEGFGQVVAEAMGCGLPVIARNSSALPEIIDAEHTGILVDGDNAGRYADAAIDLRNDQEKWNMMSIAARKRAEAHFGIERMIDRYILLYHSMMKGYNP